MIKVTIDGNSVLLNTNYITLAKHYSSEVTHVEMVGGSIYYVECDFEDFLDAVSKISKYETA